MSEEVIADNAVESGADSQPAEEINEGLDLSNADDGAKTVENDNLTKRMSERINQVRAKEVDPLKERISEYERKEAEWREKEIKLKALEEGKTVDEVQAEMAENEKTRRELIESDPEVQHLREVAREGHRKELLKVFQDAYPDDNIKDIESLDPQVFQLMIGGADPVLAYKVVKESQVQPEKKDLPGPAKGDGAAVEDGFYTKEQIESMSTEEVKKNYDAVIASMKKFT